MINMYIVQVYLLFHLLLSDQQFDQYLCSCYRKLVNFPQHLALLYSDSTNIGQIAKL